MKPFSMHGNNLTAKTVSNLNNYITECIHSHTRNNLQKQLYIKSTVYELQIVGCDQENNCQSEGLRLASLY